MLPPERAAGVEVTQATGAVKTVQRAVALAQPSGSSCPPGGARGQLGAGGGEESPPSLSAEEPERRGRALWGSERSQRERTWQGIDGWFASQSQVCRHSRLGPSWI